METASVQSLITTHREIGVTSYVDATNTETAIEIKPTSMYTGAEIQGVDLRQPLGKEVVDQVRAALLKWKVVFFRNQHLSHEQHISFARSLGVPTHGHIIFKNTKVSEFPEIFPVGKELMESRSNYQSLIRSWTGWHADVTAAINPPSLSILRSTVVPEYGGDTFFTNVGASYSALSPKYQEFLSNLRAIHSYTPNVLQHQSAKPMSAEHPVVRIHPETGERVIYVNSSFTQSIVDMTPRESQNLLEMLFEHMALPEFSTRFRWKVGDVAIWDNRSAHHLAPRDTIGANVERQHYRITLMGDIPVGPNGEKSKLISGEPLQAARAS